MQLKDDRLLSFVSNHHDIPVVVVVVRQEGVMLQPLQASLIITHTEQASELS